MNKGWCAIHEAVDDPCPWCLIDPPPPDVFQLPEDCLHEPVEVIQIGCPKREYLCVRCGAALEEGGE